jgi:hypothetical protein
MYINSSFILTNKRGETVTLHAIKVYGTSGYISPLILKMSAQFHAPLALRSGKELPVPTNFEAGWVPQPVWTF